MKLELYRYIGSLNAYFGKLNMPWLALQSLNYLCRIFRCTRIKEIILNLLSFEQRCMNYLCRPVRGARTLEFEFALFVLRSLDFHADKFSVRGNWKFNLNLPSFGKRNMNLCRSIRDARSLKTWSCLAYTTEFELFMQVSLLCADFGNNFESDLVWTTKYELFMHTGSWYTNFENLNLPGLDYEIWIIYAYRFVVRELDIIWICLRL